jgi:hypothetical protein
VTSAMSANSGSANSGSANPRPANPGPVGGGLGGLGGLLPAGRPQSGRLVMTPARRAAILIGVPIVFLIFVAGGFSVVGGVAAGSFPVTESVPIPSGKLTMNLGGGGATLRGSDMNSATARVIGTVTYHLTRPTLRVAAGDISLNCPKVNTGNCNLNATVDVPAGIALNVQTGGGYVTASGLSGGATLDTDGGELTLTNATGPSDLALASGGGDVHVSQVSGPVVTVSADGGNITGSAIAATRLTAGSGGGDVTLTLTTAPRDLQVTSDGGNVTIVVPQGTYVVDEDASGGTVSGISSSPGAQDTISVSSGGGNISVTD